VAALGLHQAAGVAVPTSDTMVIAHDGVMHSMPRRETLWRCQTPQCFRLPVITRAHQLAAADAGPSAFAPTDDCGVVLRYLPAVQVHVVPGSERNIKITYPQDLAVAEALLAPAPGAGPAACLQVRRIVLDLGQLPDRRPLLQERLDGLA
jgi:2-C-methyl-D-erythritol 4-phosphate cytidylyltransferase